VLPFGQEGFSAPVDCDAAIFAARISAAATLIARNTETGTTPIDTEEVAQMAMQLFDDLIRLNNARASA
jgi:hypothetical protein